MAVAAAISAGAGATSLSDAVTKAVTTNPRVARADAETRAAERDVRQAWGGYLPSVDLNTLVGPEDSNIKQLNAAGLDPGTLTRREVGVTVRQLVYDGFGTQAEVERRRALLESAEHGLTDTRESIAFQAVQAYLDVLLSQELVVLARDNVDAHRRTLDHVRVKTQGGVGKGADVRQAEGRLALAQSTLTAREGQLRTAVTRYQRVVGEPPADLRKPESGDAASGAGPAVDEVAVQQAIDAAVQEALNTHPALMQARSQVNASEANVRVAKSAYWPRVDLEGNLARNDNLSGVEGVRNSNSLMVVGRWNVFRGGSDRAQEQASVERRIAAEDAMADTRRAVEENVAVAVKARATSQARIAYLEEHVEASTQALAAYKAQFDIGMRTLLDMLNAENELFSARSNLASGLYDDLQNRYFIEAAKGNLTRSLGISTGQP
ncbi:MAG: TolC family outer membrane protein [Gammaproteobacteria bacterium]